MFTRYTIISNYFIGYEMLTIKYFCFNLKLLISLFLGLQVRNIFGLNGLSYIFGQFCLKPTFLLRAHLLDHRFELSEFFMGEHVIDGFFEIEGGDLW